MKKVIFICLLSLSMCLSKPADQQAGAPQSPPKPDPNAKPSEAAPPQQTTLAPANPNPANPSPANPAGASAVPGAQGTSQAPNTTTPQNSTSPQNSAAPPAEKPSDKKDDSANKSPDDKNKDKDGKKADDKPVTPPTPPAQNSTTTKPDENSTTTKKPEPVVTTEVPSKEGDKPKIVEARGFDGPSFIGGIILTLGLLAIGFMGFKYYKNQTERNYHTL